MCNAGSLQVAGFLIHGVMESAKDNIALNTMLGASRKMPSSSCARIGVFPAPGFSTINIFHRGIRSQPNKSNQSASAQSCGTGQCLCLQQTKQELSHSFGVKHCDRKSPHHLVRRAGLTKAQASRREKYVHREIHAIKGLPLPATPLAQWQPRAGMDWRFALKRASPGYRDLSAAPALRQAILEAFPKRSRPKVRLQHTKLRLRP